MFFIKKKKTICVHDGGFHADDVFACAVIFIWAQMNNFKLDIIRSRDPYVVDSSDIVADVGMIYDSSKDRFDHHQVGGAGFHYNGIPYASFGLIWQKYGEYICGNKEVSFDIENTLVIPIDARDNGVSISNPVVQNIYEYNIGSIIHALNKLPTEDQKYDYINFLKAVEFAKNILKREIEFSKYRVYSRLKIESLIKELGDNEILILDEWLDWESVLTKYKNIKLVIYPSKSKEDWSVQVTRDDINDYKSRRITFPSGWCGLRDGELSSVIGIEGAVFCTKDGWLVKAKTKESAISIAKLALHKDQN